MKSPYDYEPQDYHHENRGNLVRGFPCTGEGVEKFELMSPSSKQNVYALRKQ